MTLGWQSKLDRLHARYTLGSGLDLATVNNSMQATHPGAYTVVEAYNTKTMLFEFKLVFDDSKQETMFRMKYSGS